MAETGFDLPETYEDSDASGSSHDSEMSESSEVACDKVMFSWENEDQLTDDFRKYPKLCMRAVCALWRKQTPEERIRKETIVRNGWGFNKNEAKIGSDLAEFLTGNNVESDIRRSVEELEEFDKLGHIDCQRIALIHAGQLYDIYRMKNDPFFPSMP